MNEQPYPAEPCRTTLGVGIGCGHCERCDRMAASIEELQRALDMVRPPVVDEKGRPNQPDRTGCMCVVSPRLVAQLLADLQPEATGAIT